MQNTSVSATKLLDYWLGPMVNRDDHDDQREALWFSPSDHQDQAVRLQWKEVLLQAAAGKLTDWAANPRERLALIIALDQLPRVIYRGTARAFSYDGHALALSLAGLLAGHDETLKLTERLFFYMPLEHSEDPVVQTISLRQFERLKHDFPLQTKAVSSYLTFTRQHAAIIQRFGRFPHRNAVLKRSSTEAEKQWLNSGSATTFGQ